MAIVRHPILRGLESRLGLVPIGLVENKMVVRPDCNQRPYRMGGTPHISTPGPPHRCAWREPVGHVDGHANVDAVNVHAE